MLNAKAKSELKEVGGFSVLFFCLFVLLVFCRTSIVDAPMNYVKLIPSQCLSGRKARTIKNKKRKAGNPSRERWPKVLSKY